jgi:hypothetical protein
MNVRRSDRKVQTKNLNKSFHLTKYNYSNVIAENANTGTTKGLSAVALRWYVDAAGMVQINEGMGIQRLGRISAPAAVIRSFDSAKLFGHNKVAITKASHRRCPTHW